MKLASYQHNGKDTWGVVIDDGLIDMGARAGAKYPTIRAVLEAEALTEVASESAVRKDSDTVTSATSRCAI